MSEILTDSLMWGECKHGLPTGSCSSCRDPYRPPAKPTVEFVFNAMYDSHCAECNLPILYGQRIARMSDDTYRHYECAS